ncbi:MAG: hypothetical protein HY280_00340 [Nitrospinae bacterium]|nr:hypothetical protein [Nitrospinota bacterium]
MEIKWLKVAFVIFFIALCADGAAFAETDGSVRASYWSASKMNVPNSDADSASAWLRSSGSSGENGLGYHAEGWARNDDVFRRGVGKADLLEGYLSLTSGDWDFRAGRKVLAWGKADGINPTDNLSRRDYTLLTPDDADNRSGSSALAAFYNAEPYRFSFIWTPEFRQNVLPLGVAGITFAENMPLDTWNQWATKMESTGGKVDWSLSYFDGWDKNPNFAFKSVGLGGILVGESYGRLRSLGADAATTAGRYGFRTEAAYLSTDSLDGSNPYLKNNSLFVVAGGDRSFDGDFNVNIQYLFKEVFNYQSYTAQPNPYVMNVVKIQQIVAGQLYAVQNGATARINKKWRNDTITAEVSGVWWATQGDFLIRPRLIWRATESLVLTLGADTYEGPKDSFFGMLKNSDTVFGELRINF